MEEKENSTSTANVSIVPKRAYSKRFSFRSEGRLYRVLISFKKASICQVFVTYLGGLLLPQLLLWPLFIALPLKPSTNGLHKSQLPFLLFMYLIQCVVFSSPIAMANVLFPRNPAEDVEFYVGNWHVLVVGSFLSTTFGVLMPQFFNFNGSVKFMIWFFGFPLWCISCIAFMWPFVKHVFVKHVSQMFADTNEATSQDSERQTQRNMMIALIKIVIYTGSFAFITISEVGLLVLFVRYAGQGATSSRQFVIGSILGIASFCIRTLIPKFVFNVLKVPLSSDAKVYLSWWAELVGELLLQLAFPEISDFRVFAAMAIIETCSFVFGSLWYLPRYRHWMTSGPVQYNPTSTVHLAKKITKTVSHAAVNAGRRASNALVKPALHKNSEDLQSKLNVTENILEKERTHLFLKFWAEINASVAFISVLSVVAFTENGKFFPLSVDKETWFRSVMFSLIVCGLQVFVLVMMMIFAAQAESKESQQSISAETQFVNVFAHGFSMLSSRFFSWFSIHMTLSLMCFVLMIFLEQSHGIHSWYYG